MNASILTTLNFLTEYAFSFFSHPSYLFLGISRKLSKKSQVLHWLETAPMHMYKLYASILFVSSESLAHSHYMCSLTLFAQSPSPPKYPYHGSLWGELQQILQCPSASWLGHVGLSVMECEWKWNSLLPGISTASFCLPLWVHDILHESHLTFEQKSFGADLKSTRSLRQNYTSWPAEQWARKRSFLL